MVKKTMSALIAVAMSACVNFVKMKNGVLNFIFFKNESDCMVVESPPKEMMNVASIILNPCEMLSIAKS